jgi:signal transduction histidine kinase
MGARARWTDAAGWGLAASVVAAAATAAIALGLLSPNPDFPSAVLTQATSWVVVMTPSLAVALGIALWTARRGEAALARWMMTACAAVSAYWLAPAVGGALRNAHIGGPAVLVAAAAGAALWTTVLALLQLTALSAAAAAVGRPVARGAARFVLEVDGLAVGFSLALPATLGWLAATVRDSRSASARLTAIGAVVRVLLWVLYVLLLVQLVTPLAGAMGGGAAAGAFFAIAVLATTFVPWRLLVAWCARKADPRAAVAAASIAADRFGDPGIVAERALREALGDPDAQLLIAIEDGWVDAQGRPATPPTPAASAAEVDDEAATILTGSGGRAMAALASRTRFVDARPLLDAVRPLVERAGLEAEIRAQGERVATERRRADNAAAEARRRIERDLHDGVQGRLVSLGLGLGLARDAMADPVSRGVIDEAVGQLHDAVAELRELSSGDLSTRLSGSGLAASVGDLAGRMPVPVDLDIAPLRVGHEVETVAYFVIAEALANAIKHAEPTRLSVRVTAGEEVVVSVADDGVGGADLRAGSGLRGLQERARAVGGRLIVSEATPGGTLVEAVLPCGS